MLKKVFVILVMLFMCGCQVEPLSMDHKVQLTTHMYEPGDVEVSFEPLESNHNILLNTDDVDDGVFYVSTKADERILVRTIHEDDVYTLQLKTDGKRNTIPLQSGTGLYNIIFYKHLYDNKYVRIGTGEVDFEGDPDAAFDKSNIYVNFENLSDIEKLSDKLSENTRSDYDYIMKTISYVLENLSYEVVREKGNAFIYYSNPLYTIDDKKGACVDYAVLFASLLREKGIPCKVVVGDVDGYETIHAWNEILIDGRWTTVDLTFVDGGVKPSQIVTGNDYHPKYYY